MSDISIDLDYLKNTVTGLKSYLLSDKLFWTNLGSTPDGRRQHSALTIGGVLFALKRIEAHSSKDPSMHDYKSLSETIEMITIEWNSAWTSKAELELRSRLRQWRMYIDELVSDRESHAPFYKHEVKVRTMLNLIISIVELKPDSKEVLDLADRELNKMFTPGDFIWEEELKDTFAQEDFWFLWGILDR